MVNNQATQTCKMKYHSSNNYIVGLNTYSLCSTLSTHAPEEFIQYILKCAPCITTQFQPLRTWLSFMIEIPKSCGSVRTFYYVVLLTRWSTQTHLGMMALHCSEHHISIILLCHSKHFMCTAELSSKLRHGFPVINFSKPLDGQVLNTMLLWTPTCNHDFG